MKQDGRFDALVLAVERLVREAAGDEFLARPMTEGVARLLQAAELMRYSTPEVTAAFLTFGDDWCVGFDVRQAGFDHRQGGG